MTDPAPSVGEPQERSKGNLLQTTIDSCLSSYPGILRSEEVDKIADHIVRGLQRVATGLKPLFDAHTSAAPQSTDMICERHPWLSWPHAECAGPGCPQSAAIPLMRHQVRNLQIAVRSRDALIVESYYALTSAAPHDGEEAELRRLAVALCETRAQIQDHPARKHDKSVQEFGACAICYIHAQWLQPRLAARAPQGETEDEVTCCLSNPDLVVHRKHKDCEHEEPHQWDECGVVHPPQGGDAALREALREAMNWWAMYADQERIHTDNPQLMASDDDEAKKYRHVKSLYHAARPEGTAQCSGGPWINGGDDEHGPVDLCSRCGLRREMHAEGATQPEEANPDG